MKGAFAAVASAVLLTACAALQAPADIPVTYLLESRVAAVPQRSKQDIVLAVPTPRAHPGFDTAQMAYVRREHEIEYFVKSRWADTPARMMAPLIADAIERSGGARAVAQGPAAAHLRLDIELVRLLQDFTPRPSHVRLTVRAQLLEVESRRIVATQEFDEVENAVTEDAYGGVLAANRALGRLLERLGDFVAEHAVRHTSR